jgi:hypothetical protein
MLATKVFYVRRKAEVYGRTSLPASATSTITFKARELLDSKVFEARAMLATEVKVVIISPSMLELSIKVVKDRAVLATQAAKARAVLKFLVYNKATCSFVSAE